MNVFADLHHGDLYLSLHLLFEERLGMNLYRPIGIDWFQKGFWKIAEPYGNAPDTIDQYLGIPKATWDSKKEPTQRYGDVEFSDNVYRIPLKIGSGYYWQKAITFDVFEKMDFDYIICTYGAHDYPYYELVQKYKPKAIYLAQIGNSPETRQHCKNVLLAGNWPMPPGTNYIKYHPEHDTAYTYVPPTNHDTIRSFISAPLVEPDLPLFYEYEKLLQDFKFRMHGILGRDGVLSGETMPSRMKDCAFDWHVKHMGCCGFVPRQAMASGRPCIIKKSYCYQHHSLARDLFEDGLNCIDLDLNSAEENVRRIRYYAEPSRHAEMCRLTAEKFKKDVDFAQEAEKIRVFLEGLRKK
jgi:hypothetical protein